MATATAMAPATPRGPGRWLPALLMALGLAALVVEAAVFSQYGTTVYDDGGYAYEGWLTVAHGWMPYRDYYARVTPLLSYIYGLPQYLFGPSILVGRLTSVVLTLVGLGLGMVCARRLAGDWAAVLTIWLFAVNPSVLSYHFHAYAVGVTACFIGLTACALTWQRRPVAGAYLGALGVALFLLCRHDLLAMALVAWAYLLFWHPAPRRHRLGAVLGSFALIIAVMLPFYLAAPEVVRYALTVGRSAPPDLRPQAYMIGQPVTLFTIAWHLMMWLRYHAHAILLLVPAAGLVVAAGLAGRRLRAMLAGNAPVLLVFGLGLAHFAAIELGVLAIRYSPSTILYPFGFLPIAVAAAIVFMKAGRHFRQPGQRSYHVLLGVLAIVFVPVLVGRGAHVQFSLARPTDLERVAIGAQLIARYTTPADRIFTTGDPQFFLEARRFLLPALTEQFFNFRDSRDTARLRRYNFFNQEIVHEWLSGEATVAVVSDGALEWLRHSGRYAGGEALVQQIMADIARNYDLVATAAGAYQGTTRVYRLKAPPPR